MATKRQLDDPNADVLATVSKRRHDDGDDDEIFTSFPDRLIRRLAKHLGILCCEDDYVFKTLKILNCNGADYNGGVPFSKAYCSVITGERTLLFGSIFFDGIKILRGYLKDRQVPTDSQEKRLLRKLLRFVSDKEMHVPLRDLEKLNETEVIIVLANHLYGKLATSSKYVIDKNTSKKSNNCPCSSKMCSLSGQFGDTGIGNEEVWHGNFDVIVDNDRVGVCYPSETKADSPGVNSTVEVKLKLASLCRNQQIISETITFSFLQKQRHPDSRHFLFPCLGVTNTGMVVYFYDSQKDILLESSLISFVSAEGKINMKAILASWFVVNYRYLSSGIPHSRTPEQTAGFFPHVREKLEIYKHDLKLGNVGVSVKSLDDEESDLEVEPSDFLSETRWELLAIGCSMSGNQS